MLLGGRPFPSCPAGGRILFTFARICSPAGGVAPRYLACIAGIDGTGKTVIFKFI